MAHHAVDLMYLFRDYNHFFAERKLRRQLEKSDAIGEAWLDFISGEEPWPSEQGLKAAHFGENGMELVTRYEVRMDSKQKDRLRMWAEVGLVKVGQIANLWMSEQDSRCGEEDFVF